MALYDPAATTSNGGGGYWAGPGVTYPVEATPNVPAPGNDANQIQGWYSKFLGRNASDAEIQSHSGNPGGLGAVQNLIANSPEADAYAKAQHQGPYAPAASPSGYSGANIFSDPATSQYEELLKGLVGKLNTPYQAPDMQGTLDAIKSYITRLNGPAYTPDQMALMQTQAFDPIMQARDQENENIIRRFAAQGMGPSSGPVQAAILANNQRYGQMGTSARANVATSAIGQQNQNQANAIGLQAQLPTLETNANTYNNSNSLQAANLAGIVPQMAWSRLTGANTGLSQTNPLSALSLLGNFQQMGQQNGAQYSAELMQVLPYLLQMFGIK